MVVALNFRVYGFSINCILKDGTGFCDLNVRVAIKKTYKICFATITKDTFEFSHGNVRFENKPLWLRIDHIFSAKCPAHTMTTRAKLGYA